MGPKWAARIALVFSVVFMGSVLGVWSATEWASAQAGPPTCIDAFPEADTNNPADEHFIAAVVTDGALDGDRADGDETCGGNPVSGVEVVWEIEVDDPDAWISRAEDQATTKTDSSGDAQPDTITTTTDGDGYTYIGIKLDTAAEGTSVIAARIQDAEDPESDPLCEIEDNPLCPHESDEEDDVEKTWANSEPASTQTPPPPPPRATSTGTGTGTGTATGTGTEPAVASRTLTLSASKNLVRYGRQVTLSGTLNSDEESCDDAGERIEISRRAHGQLSQSQSREVTTDANGTFELTLTPKRSADYTARAPAHDNCGEAQSNDETVLVRVKVSIAVSDARPSEGDKIRFTGAVKPRHRGSLVILQRLKNDRWKNVKEDGLNRRSRYSIGLRVTWDGQRVFRVKWPKQHNDHATGKSRGKIVRA